MTVDFTNGAIGTIQASRTAAGQFDQLDCASMARRAAIEIIYDTGVRAFVPASAATADTATWRDVPFDPVETNYQRFVGAVRAGRTQEPSFRRATDIQKVLDVALVSDREHRDVAVA